MADGDLPVLPPNFFNQQTWNFHTDFHSLQEIGKGKVRSLVSKFDPDAGAGAQGDAGLPPPPIDAPHVALPLPQNKTDPAPPTPPNPPTQPTPPHPTLSFPSTHTLPSRHIPSHKRHTQDTVIYSALCPRLGGQCVAVKVYDRATLQASEAPRLASLLLAVGCLQCPSLCRWGFLPLLACT